MATVGMPDNGAEFFCFVRGGIGENKDLVLFPTYAHLLCAAAALGSARGVYVDEPVLREKDPRPIELETFKTQELYDLILIMVIKYCGDVDVVRDVSKICANFVSLAAGGFDEMRAAYKECASEHYWPEAWENLVLEYAPERG